MKEENGKKIILDLCGGTGAWSRPYQEMGYTVYNITLPKYDIRKTKITEDELIFRKDTNDNYRLKVKKNDIYGILAAPPCVEFSLAAGKKLKDRNTDKGLELVNICLKIIWKCKPKFWALENPVGYLRNFLGKPPFTFKQWEFGDKGIKPTDIWGFFKIPTKKVKIKPPKALLLYISAGGSSGRKPRRNLGKVEMRSSKIGSITPKGFAEAFFLANQ